MRFNLTVFTVLFACACLSAATSGDQLSQMLTGAASALKINVDVASMMSAGTETSFTTIMTAMTKALSTAASCDPTQFQAISDIISAAAKTIPDSQKQALISNPETKKFINAVGVAGKTPDQIKAAVLKYIMYNIITICTTVGDFNTKLQAGDFNGLGSGMATLISAIFNEAAAAENIVLAFMAAEFVQASSDHLTDFFNGAAKALNIELDAASILSTASSASLDIADNAISTVLPLAAQCDPSSVTSISKIITDAATSIPNDQRHAFMENPETQKFLKAVGIFGKNPQQIQAAVVSYVMNNIVTICGSFDELNEKLQAGDYAGLGGEGASILRDIFNESEATEIIAFTLLAAKMF